jgi:hypothetical protein
MNELIKYLVLIFLTGTEQQVGGEPPKEDLHPADWISGLISDTRTKRGWSLFNYF